jgi:PPK2 family polyphosphate:nucleotide phosphotransferase
VPLCSDDEAAASGESLRHDIDVSSITAPFVVTKGRDFRLRRMDPRGSGHLPLSKDDAPAQLAGKIAKLAALQQKLYAHNKWGVLLIFQAMDAAGKDSVIRHVLSGVNPQGCSVASFKAPSPEELSHDYLWRTTVRLPERGRIGVFNRSYYEEVLVARVHPELLESQRLPSAVVTKNIWQERFEDIAAFERHLARNGYVIRKFFLNVSREEQRQRFLQRLEEPEKRWKFSMGDVRERERWDDYMKAYEDMIRNTSAPHAPWIVVPADRKWFAHHVVASAVVEALEELDLKVPKMSATQRGEMQQALRELESQGGKRGA